MLSITLRRLIDQKMTTAREIGELTGTAPSTVYRWIRDEAQPSFDTIRLLMRHLRNREAQAALIAAFTASTPWKSYVQESVDPAPADDAADASEAMEAAIDAMREATQALAAVRQATRDRALNDTELDQTVQQTNSVIRTCVATQRELNKVAGHRRGGNGAPQPVAQKTKTP
jgi:predicted transcriptional regulator